MRDQSQMKNLNSQQLTGNGTLALNILSYIMEHAPDIYENTKYNIIEISPRMAAKQKENREKSPHKETTLQIHNQSILKWNEITNDPCFVIGTEVLVAALLFLWCLILPTQSNNLPKDNLPHDKIIYDDEGKPWACYACEDHNGHLWEEVAPLRDQMILKYLHAKSKALGWKDLLLPEPQGIISKVSFSSSPTSYIP